MTIKTSLSKVQRLGLGFWIPPCLPPGCVEGLSWLQMSESSEFGSAYLWSALVKYGRCISWLCMPALLHSEKAISSLSSLPCCLATCFPLSPAQSADRPLPTTSGLIYGFNSSRANKTFPRNSRGRESRKVKTGPLPTSARPTDDQSNFTWRLATLSDQRYKPKHTEEGTLRGVKEARSAHKYHQAPGGYPQARPGRDGLTPVIPLPWPLYRCDLFRALWLPPGERRGCQGKILSLTPLLSPKIMFSYFR